jgi:hypothetical protein
MLVKEAVEVFEGLSQAKKVREITDLDSFFEFQRAHFKGSEAVTYAKTVTIACDNPGNNADYFRLLGLMGILSIQYGFPALNGHLYRHGRKEWNLSPFDSGHLLGVIGYMAEINAQAFDGKKALSEQLSEIDQDAAVGIWNVKLPVFNGHVAVERRRTLQNIRDEASARYFKPVPIYKPDQEINKRLAAMNFTGHDAESVSYQDFERNVLPKVAPVLRRFLNPDLAFDNYHQRNFPIPEVDLPKSL